MSGGEGPSSLAFASTLAVAGAAAWLYHLAHRRDEARIEPYLRWLDPRAYHANNPPWLANAAIVASSQTQPAGSSAARGAAGDALAALPAPVRQAVRQLQRAGTEGEGGIAFGAAARRALFMLEAGTAYLNHGSYGAALQLAVQAQRHFQERLEAQPVRFMEEEALPAMRHAQLALADLVGARPADLVFVPNATTAINAVLQSIQLGPGDLILTASTTYPAVRSAAARVAAQRGAALLEVELLEVLAQPDQVLARYQAALRAGGGRVRLAVVDQVVSVAPVHLPVAALCALCAAAGALSLVDGAHAVGALPLDVPALACDFYTSNAHKWLCTPKGAAFLWAAPHRQPDLLPLVTSHGHGLGFQAEFMWSGTSDLTPFMALPTAIAVWRALGPAAARYRHSLLQSAVGLLMRRWGTGVALGVQAPEACMSSVELPPFSGRPPSVQLAHEVHEALRSRHRIEVPVACFAGRLFCRISVQIYNEMSDYERLAAAVLELAAGRQGGVSAGTSSS